MKKLALAVSLLLLGVFATPAVVDAAEPSTTVKGSVYVNGNTAQDASVKVLCYKGDKTYERNTNTNSLGRFSVSYPAGNCKLDARVVVSAVKGEASGMAEGVVTTVDSKLIANVDVQMGNVAVPEFGPIIAASTAVASIGAFVFIRRKQYA